MRCDRQERWRVSESLSELVVGGGCRDHLIDQPSGRERMVDATARKEKKA